MTRKMNITRWLNAQRNPHTFIMLVLVIIATPVLAQEPSSPTMSHKGWPESLVQQMYKESRNIKELPVTIGESNFTSSVLGKSIEQPELIDQDWYLSVDIGPETPMECWVYTSLIDTAATLYNLAEAGKNVYAQDFGKIENQFIYYIDTGAIGDVPYMALEMLYILSLKTTGERASGMVKVRIAGRDDFYIACMHIEFGYRKTFARSFEHFVTEAQYDSETPQPFYREIFRHSIGRQAVGFVDANYAIDADGDHVITRVTAMLTPSDRSTVRARDMYSIGFWTPKGALINQRDSMGSKGELDTRIDLVARENNAFAVSGFLEGKEIELEIENADAPESPILQHLQLQQLFSNPDRDSVTMTGWLPEVDPTRFQPLTFTFDPGGRRELLGTFTLGPTSVKAQLDQYGSMIHGTMQIGAHTIAIKRIRNIGEPPVLNNEK